MNMIRTKKVRLSSKEYFKIILSTYIRRRWYLIVLMWILALSFIMRPERDLFVIFFIVFAILYPIIIIFQYWRFANSKDNKLFLIEREYEIDENRIVGSLGDGTESTTLLEHFIKVIDLKEVYLLYLSKNQFVYIPKNSFETGEDRVWFESKVLSKIKG